MPPRKRFRDKFNIGRSGSVPYKPGEHWTERHSRRKAEALKRQQEVEGWCEKNGWSLRINNEGHHWIFITSQRKMIEWFPSSGKLVIGKQWKQGFHVHDVDQLFEVLKVCLENEKK